MLSRIAAETGLLVSRPSDQHILSGIFNKYRPNGVGVERILAGGPLEEMVCSRVRQVFDATSKSWVPGDFYFVVRNSPDVSEADASEFARKYLCGLFRVAEISENNEVCEIISSLNIVEKSSDLIELNDDVSISIYECLTDFLAKMQPDKNEIFILKEAFYSMANDYALMAYMLWPVICDEKLPIDNLDGYFELWRHGLTLKFYGGDEVYICRELAI